MCMRCRPTQSYSLQNAYIDFEFEKWVEVKRSSKIGHANGPKQPIVCVGQTFLNMLRLNIRPDIDKQNDMH